MKRLHNTSMRGATLGVASAIAAAKSGIRQLP